MPSGSLLAGLDTGSDVCHGVCRYYTKDETDNLPSLCGPQGYVPVTQMSQLRLTEPQSTQRHIMIKWQNWALNPFYIVLFLLLCQLLCRQTQDYDYPSK